MNRDITIKAKALIDKYIILLKERKKRKEKLKFYQELGHLLNSHQQQLKENIQVSTEKIDKILDNCAQSGALGGKINGSGFGGTMFVFAPGKEEIIKNIIKDSGSEAFIVKTSDGVGTY